MTRSTITLVSTTLALAVLTIAATLRSEVSPGAHEVTADELVDTLAG